MPPYVCDNVRTYVHTYIHMYVISSNWRSPSLLRHCSDCIVTTEVIVLAFSQAQTTRDWRRIWAGRSNPLKNCHAKAKTLFIKLTLHSQPCIDNHAEPRTRGVRNSAQAGNDKMLLCGSQILSSTSCKVRVHTMGVRSPISGGVLRHVWGDAYSSSYETFVKKCWVARVPPSQCVRRKRCSLRNLLHDHSKNQHSCFQDKTATFWLAE